MPFGFVFGSTFMKLLLGCLLFCLLSNLALALDYKNPELGFKATLPDNLEDVSIRVGIRGGLISLGKWDSSKKELVKLVSLQDLGAPIGREDLSKRTDKPKNVALEKAPWKTFQIDVFRVVETAGTLTNVTFNAQVPLKPHAIQVTMAGPVADEASLRREMQTVVASIDGASNWLTTEERVTRFGSGIGRLIVSGVVLIIMIFVCVRVGKMIRKVYRGTSMD